MTQTETTDKKNVYHYPVNEYDEYGVSVNEQDGKRDSVNVYDEYDKKRDSEYVYDEYVLTEEDIILQELNTRYKLKGAYVALALVTAAFSTGTIIMSQKWAPPERTSTTTTTVTTSMTTTTTTTLTTTLPESNPDQVRDS